MASTQVTDLLTFIDESPTPYHATRTTATRLQRAGFRELVESEAWQLRGGDRVYVRRADASIAAFVLGSSAPSDAGFRLIGAHTDSPNLRLKPNAEIQRAGYAQLAVETYGGLLLSTWLDRDLTLAGRVFVRGPIGLEPVLIHLKQALLRIPNLAIHLNRTVNTAGLLLNPQRHLVPVLGLGGQEDGFVARRLAAQASTEVGRSVAPEDIVASDLCLCDTQPSALGGEQDAFIFAPRMDNLASCHAAIHALVEAPPDRAETRGFVLYDHEEVGSRSAQGADSTFLEDCLRRICAARGVDDAQSFPRAAARSFLISCDMAHAVHPNYQEMHEDNHKPVLGAGPVIKRHSGQSYATDAESEARFIELCSAANVVPQQFVTRSDLSCGSTIGPLSAARLGIRTVDVGSPLLSMHSIREMGASADVDAMIAVLGALFRA